MNSAKKTSALLTLGLLLACGGETTAPVDLGGATVATVEPVRGSLVLAIGEGEVAVRENQRVPLQAHVQTGPAGRGVLRLDTGGWVLLGHGTDLHFPEGVATLEGGAAWVDARETVLAFRVGDTRFTVNDATVSFERTGDDLRVYVGSGELSFQRGEGESETDGRLVQGELFVVENGEDSVQPADLWDDWTGGMADPAPRREAAANYIGGLYGRLLEQRGIARRPLVLRAHEVAARVRGDLAVTTVEQTFFNAESNSLETEYRVRLPQGALVRGFAVDRGHGFEQANVAPMEGEGYGVSFRPPSYEEARLIYEGPDQVRARIHPVAAGATVRVRLIYSEWLERRENLRHYIYPMTVDGLSAPLVGEMRVRVDAFGAGAGAIRAGMEATVEANEVTLRRSDWRPSADFHVQLEDPPSGEASPEALAYIVPSIEQQLDGSEEEVNYLYVDVAPGALHGDALEEGPNDESALDLVILLDTSGGIADDDLELARSTIRMALAQMAPEDRVTLRFGDLHAWSPSEELRTLAPVSEQTERIEAALADIPRGGATDLATQLREAGELVAGRTRGLVLYLGDALPSTGALSATEIHEELATLAAPPRYFGVAIGEGANLPLLRRLFGKSGLGGAAQIGDRREASRQLLALMAEAGRPMLRDLRIDLGPAVERVYPQLPTVLPAGAPLRVIGVLRDELPAEVVLSGLDASGLPFERSVPLTRRSPTWEEDNIDIPLRWGAARLQTLLDTDAGREAITAIATRFGLLSPYTAMTIGGGYWAPCQGFDGLHPNQIDWARGGGAPGIEIDDAGDGWRRRRPGGRSSDAPVAMEETWVSRTQNPYRGGSSLSDLAVRGVLGGSLPGPQACYERRLVVRPDLQGQVELDLQIGADGSVSTASVKRSTLGAADVDACVAREVLGVRFGDLGSPVQISHTFTFSSAGRGIGRNRACSDASRQELGIRRRLWRERIAANSGAWGALDVWADAQRQCELGSWRAKRALLGEMLRSVRNVRGRLILFRRLRGQGALGSVLRRAILRAVRTPQDLVLARAGLGLDPDLDWKPFADRWEGARDDAAKLALLRRWLEVLPHDIDLQLRLMNLLERTGALPEARRVARALRADPLADARVRSEVGELYLRQGDEAMARRVFSELVEDAARDSWARARLGDLYLAHGWYDDAYREYQTLLRLRAGDPEVLLELARAAGGAERLDQALRLEQRVSEGDLESDDGLSATARLRSTVRLASEMAGSSGDRVERLRQRARTAGLLRGVAPTLVAITWDHPDDAPELSLRRPDGADPTEWERAEIQAKGQGIEAARIHVPLDEALQLRVVRPNIGTSLRTSHVQVIVMHEFGGPHEDIQVHELELNAETPSATLAYVRGSLSTR